jgi:hypothetical protein
MVRMTGAILKSSEDQQPGSNALLALLGLSESFHVRQVFGAPGSELVSNETVATDERNTQAVKFSSNA